MINNKKKEKKSSKRNLLINIITEVIFIFIVYSTCIVGFHKLSIIKASQYDMYFNSTQVISTYRSKIDSEIMSQIKNDENVEKIVPLNVEKTLMNTKIQEVPVPIIGVNKEDLIYLMKNYDCTLIKGRLPEKKDEIILCESVAKGKNVDIDEYIKEDRKVVGIINSPYLVNFRYIDNEMSAKLKDYCILIVEENNKNLSEGIVDKLQNDGYKIINKEKEEKDTEPIVNSLILMIIFINVLYLCIKLALCINKKIIIFNYKLDLLGHVLAIMIGIGLGISFTYLYNKIILSNNGIVANLIEGKSMIVLFIIPMLGYIANYICKYLLLKDS